MTWCIHHKHAYKHTHMLKVCGPSLIDQNNVAAVTFSPGTDHLPCLRLIATFILVSLCFWCVALSLSLSVWPCSAATVCGPYKKQYLQDIYVLIGCVIGFLLCRCLYTALPNWIVIKKKFWLCFCMFFLLIFVLNVSFSLSVFSTWCFVTKRRRLRAAPRTDSTLPHVYSTVIWKCHT